MSALWISAATALAADEPPAAPPKLNKVIVERGIMVPMRDGVKLATDIYLPTYDGGALEEKRPAVLMRTPYDRTRAMTEMSRYFAERGYMAVTQDCRGRYGSEGKFLALRQEPEDGYDTIEWVAHHKACSGKVGMYGVSYMAWDQYEVATLTPPSLATMMPHCGPTNAYRYSIHVGGTLALTLLKWHLEMAMSSQEAKQNPNITRAIGTMASGDDFLRWAAAVPWRRGQTPLALAPLYEDAAFKYYFENYDYNDFWRQRGLAMDEHIEAFPDVPTLSIVGWYEAYTRSIVDSYQKLVAAKRGPHFLLVGPWTHANTRPSCGDVNFGAVASEIPGVGSFLELHHQWFNRQLRGEKDARIGAPVKIFIMGGGDGRRGEGGRLNHGGAWNTGDTWPPKGVHPVKFYFHPSGLLAREKPSAASSSTSYTYDPRNTVSSDGRCEIAYGPAIDKGFEGMGPRDQIQLRTLPGHGMPGMPIIARTDVLTFDTEPLARDVTLAGNIVARLHISSDAPDTDFFLKLVDVYPPSDDYPTGYALPITDGVLRARYRESFERPVLMRPGEVYKLTIPLQPGANLFRRGHRIRIYVTSSSFPSHDINRNTGDPRDRRWRIANNTIYHDAARPSHVELPVME